MVNGQQAVQEISGNIIVMVEGDGFRGLFIGIL